MPEIEIEDKAIIEQGVRATIRFYEAMSTHHLSCPGVVAVVANLIDPLLNLVVNAALSEEEVEEKIEAVFKFYQAYQVEWFWQVGPLSQPKTLPQQLILNGLSLVEVYPALYFDLRQALPIFATPELVIKEVMSHDLLQEWVKPIREAFPSSDKAEGYRQLNATLAHGPGTAFRHYVGYHLDHAVCAGTLFVTEEAVMIHNIATRPNFRKRGFGTAMTLYAMQMAKDLERPHCFLDSSPKGMGMYQRIGFKVYAYNQLFGAK